MNAKSAGLVGTGRDHAPTAGFAADDHRHTPQRRSVKLLDRGEKSIHIDMNDLADGRLAHQTGKRTDEENNQPSMTISIVVSRRTWRGPLRWSRVENKSAPP